MTFKMFILQCILLALLFSNRVGRSIRSRSHKSLGRIGICAIAETFVPYYSSCQDLLNAIKIIKITKILVCKMHQKYFM